MFVDYTTWETFEYKVSSLHLDDKNPRLGSSSTKMNQTQIMAFLINNEGVYELARKISDEGYFVGELPIICFENEKKIVLEGNRRTAALKLLLDPKKYLHSEAKAKILIQNVLKNNFSPDKVKCYIAPNRLFANPIIYERHKGETLKKWKAGNQYSFVAKMYYDDGLTIDEICEVLNETRARIVNPLKAYNLFYEGKVLFEKETNSSIEISEFDITNLERFYGYIKGKEILGIDFNNENGDLIIKIPRAEFEKRLFVIFNKIKDADRFSRDFNNEQDKENYIKALETNSNFDFSVPTNSSSTISRGSEKKTNLDEQRAKIKSRRGNKSQGSFFNNYIISRDKQIFFDNQKLDELFAELKSLTVDKKYSFAVLLRTYLEQSLYFYLDQRSLLDQLNVNGKDERLKTGSKKVDGVIDYIKGKNPNVSIDIDKEQLMNILRFSINKEYSDSSLKSMLDYIVQKEIPTAFDAQTAKNLKVYIDNVKNELDLSVHNINTIIDTSHNQRAWQTLEKLFDYLSCNIKN